MIKNLCLSVILASGCLTLNTAMAVTEGSEMVDNIANFRFDKLGHPQIQSDSIQPVLAAQDRP
ncbi:MAG TPA: hypothetical protein VJ984_10110, partial [Xanthomonadales bacterium]|nr:hypothetical protein [Xanthomonadales bacterium]